MIIVKLTSEIKNAKFFSVLADEASDISNEEQMALVTRYVNNCSDIKETFLPFLHCNEGLTGGAVSRKNVDSIQDLNIYMDLCHGQGYDGAGNMDGKCSGAASILIRLKFILSFMC